VDYLDSNLSERSVAWLLFTPATDAFSLSQTAAFLQSGLCLPLQTGVAARVLLLDFVVL